MSAFAQLKSVDDPRDRLDRATRAELARFAAQSGVSEIKPEMPAMLMRQILRTKGLTNIQIPNRVLGRPSNGQSVVQTAQANVPATDAVSDLARQWEQQQAKPATAKEPTITELRSAAKAKGIKIARTDTKDILKAKLNGKQDAA